MVLRHTARFARQENDLLPQRCLRGRGCCSDGMPIWAIEDPI